jgi:preprotein translocase subunit YajC
MRTFTLVLILSLFLFSVVRRSTAQDQQNSSSSQARNPSESANNGSIEGTVVSVSRATLVVRTGDNQFQLFTYGPDAVRPSSLVPGVRVRVTAGLQDENGTRVASNVTVLTPGTSANSSIDKGAQAAPVPEKVQEVESDIKRESRRWRLGVRAGAAFDPELFTFGVQSQMGPIFHPRVLFRPNAEFAFGEVTDLIALNLEGVYRFSNSYRGKWTPYVGAGPALIFIHQSFDQPREINFGNFDYETGFNVLAGMQSRRGTFVELKTSLWSGPAPTLRVIVGYNF